MPVRKIAVIGDSHVNFFGGHEYLTFTPYLRKTRTVGYKYLS